MGRKMTRAERLAMIDENLRQNDINLKEGRITEDQHETCKRDGRKAKAEIRARDRKYFR